MNERISNPNKVICPACVHEFSAIPVNAQKHLSEIEELLHVVGYYNDEGMGEFTLPTSGAIAEHGWKPVVLREDAIDLLGHAISIMRGMIAEADRETNPFIAAKMFLEKVRR